MSESVTELKANTVKDYSPPTAEMQQQDSLSATHPYDVTGIYPHGRASSCQVSPFYITGPGSREGGAAPASLRIPQPSNHFINNHHVSHN